MKTLIKNLFMLALAAALLLAGGCAPAPYNGGDVTTVTPQVNNLPTDNPSGVVFTRIQLSFKLDPRLGGGTYGGEVWVSPDTYTGASAQDTVEAMAQGIDANGQSVPINPEWTPSDPEMVTVSPTQSNQVTITVHRAGESSLQVSAQGISKTLTIKATSQNNVMQVVISQ